jgi:TRAP-type mannitol/chloroaromatic compound transport system substrate-binding protein
LANELTNPDNILWFPGLFTSTQTGAFCRIPIRSLKEAKGKKFRIGPGLHMEVLQKHDIRPVSMAPQEIYGALERGVVDMVEWLTPATDYPLKFHEVAPYILAPAWWQPTGLRNERCISLWGF